MSTLASETQEKRPLSRSRMLVKMCFLCGSYFFAFALTNYQTVYLKENGFSASRLGILMAICSVVNIFGVSFWGMLSDRFQSLRKVLVVQILAGSLLSLLIPAVGKYIGVVSLAMMIVYPTMNFFRGLSVTFESNLVVRTCQDHKLNYGLVRGLGSLTYTICGLILSAIVGKYCSTADLFWISGLLYLPAVFLILSCPEPSRGIPVEESGKGSTQGKEEESAKNHAQAVPEPEKKHKDRLHLEKLLGSRTYLLFLVFAFVFFIAKYMDFNYLLYFMEDLGVPGSKYGAVVSYRAMYEIPLLFLMGPLRKKVSLRSMIAAGAVLMVVECFGFVFFTHSLGSMLFFCTFYGIGNGMFIGASENYVYQISPEGLKASGQAFYTSVSQTASIVGSLFGGFLYDGIGARFFYMATGVLFAVSILFFILSGHKPAKTAKTTG